MTELPKPYYSHAGQTIYHGDCRDIIGNLPNWDCLITSPPYGQQRDYTIGKFNWDDLVPVALATTPIGDRQVFVNLGLVHKDGEVQPYWNSLIASMKAKGWRHFGWYVWDQLNGLPGDWNGRLAPSHEWIFHFNIQSRTPEKTVPTKKPGRPHDPGGLRKPDGSIAKWSGGCVQEKKIEDSVIRLDRVYSRGQIENEHPAIYPIGLPTRIIQSYTAGNETILDPFMGSGTTLVAAKALGRKCIGIEIEEKYCAIAVQRLSQEVMDFS